MTTNEVSTENLPVRSLVVATINGIRCNAEIISSMGAGGFYAMQKYNSADRRGAVNVHESQIESVLWIAGEEA